MVPRGGQRAWLSVSDFILYFLIFSAIVDRRNVVLSLGFDGIPGDYCRVRRPEQCCRSRDDDCTAPILGNHLCYCDIFCREHPGNDCCPDFGPVCEGIQPPPPPPSSGKASVDFLSSNARTPSLLSSGLISNAEAAI